MTKEEIGKTLKEARLKRGLTQTQVADRLGCRQQTIGNWETGYSQPDANTLFLLCDFYGISIDDTFGGGKSVKVSIPESELLQKYRELDCYGQALVDTVIKHELQRCVSQQHLALEDRIRQQADAVLASVNDENTEQSV